MIRRFDHLVIAVADLDRAIGAYESLGFEVFPGGRHENLGTHNALIRFGNLGYIELLGVHDPGQAAESGLNGRTLAAFVRHRPGGLVGHCYATDDIEAEAARARESGIEMVGPFEMRRARPDGRTLRWRLTMPVDIPWRRPWPFVIEWDDPDEERRAVEGVGRHANGASFVAGVSVAVRDPEETVNLYSVLFASEPFRRDEVTDLAASRASFEVGGFVVDLLSPVGDGPVQKALTDDGEGPFEARIGVEGTGKARDQVPEARESGEALVLPQDRTLGARLAFVEGTREG